MPVVFTSTLGDLGAGMAWAGTMGYLATETSQVYLDNRIAESNGALVYGWDVLEEYFPPGVLAAMFQSYEELLRRLADGEDAAWGQHPRASIIDARWREVLDINTTGAPLTDELLHRLGMVHLRARPQHPPSSRAPGRSATRSCSGARARSGTGCASWARGPTRSSPWPPSPAGSGSSACSASSRRAPRTCRSTRRCRTSASPTCSRTGRSSWCSPRAGSTTA